MGGGLRRRCRAVFPCLQSGAAGSALRSAGHICAPLDSRARRCDGQARAFAVARTLAPEGLSRAARGLECNAPGRARCLPGHAQRGRNPTLEARTILPVPLILTINAGSSSIKFALFECAVGSAGGAPRRLDGGSIERIGLSDGPTADAALEQLLQWISGRGAR